MSPATIFNLQLGLGYVPWLFFVGAYIWPRIASADDFAIHRANAIFHSFRFFGLVFILPGVVGKLPDGFGPFAAYGDFATGILAMLALATMRMRPLFWLFTLAFNLVGIVDLLGDYYLGATLDLPTQSGELGATYWIPILYVPILMITHLIAFYLLARSRVSPARHDAVAAR